jgi:hypothetical protein
VGEQGDAITAVAQGDPTPVGIEPVEAAVHQRIAVAHQHGIAARGHLDGGGRLDDMALRGRALEDEPVEQHGLEAAVEDLDPLPRGVVHHRGIHHQLGDDQGARSGGGHAGCPGHGAVSTRIALGIVDAAAVGEGRFTQPRVGVAGVEHAGIVGQAVVVGLAGHRGRVHRHVDRHIPARIGGSVGARVRRRVHRGIPGPGVEIGVGRTHVAGAAIGRRHGIPHPLVPR